MDDLQLDYIVNFLVDPDDKTYCCWITERNRPYEIIEAAYSDDDFSFNDLSIYQNWKVISYSHQDINKALGFFWQIVAEFSWKCLNQKAIKELERSWFD